MENEYKLGDILIISEKEFPTITDKCVFIQYIVDTEFIQIIRVKDESCTLEMISVDEYDVSLSSNLAEKIH